MAPLMVHIPGPIEKNPVWRDLQCAEQLLHQLYRGKIQALIISGPPGVGKSHLGEKIAREYRQKWNPERPGSFIGLMRIFKQHARGGVLVCDDLDELWSNSKALEVLQIALDTTERRFLSHSVGGKANSIERFELNCAAIFLSNLDFQDAKVLRTHGVAAVKSRSILAPISFDPLALYEYTGWLCTAGGMLRKVFVDRQIGRTITARSGERITITRANARRFITREDANHVLEHFAKYAARYPSIGPRELFKFARLRIGADPDEWESWITRQLTREPVWVFPAPLYVYRIGETPPAPPLPEPVPSGAASGPSGAAPGSPLTAAAAPAPLTVSKKRGAGSSFDRDAYMTCMEVARPMYAHVERILAQVGINLSDLWWAEVCAGSGNILRQMPVDRRVGWDINPLDNGALGIIRIDDYSTQRLDPSKSWAVLTNPSFKRQGPLALFNWAAEQDCVVAIGLIAPHYFQRYTVENKLHRYFHREHREVLAPDSFLRDGQRKYSPAIFDIWVRRDYMRDLMVVRTVHPDWLWLPAKQRAEADWWMQSFGVGFGDVKDPDDLGKIQEPSWHWQIKEVRPGTGERLKKIDWQKVALPTVTIPRLHKDEVVAAYIAEYGELEDGSSGEDAAAPVAPAPAVAPPEDPSADPDSHPDIEWIPPRRGYHEATVWIGRRGPNVGKILDGTKQVPTIPGDHYALICRPPAVAILRSIPWRSMAVGGTLSKHTISREYTCAKLGRLATCESFGSPTCVHRD
jgi:DNA polymerase III delta prime subunit